MKIRTTDETIQDALLTLEARLNIIEALTCTALDTATGRTGEEREALNTVSALLEALTDEINLLQGELDTASQIDRNMRRRSV